MPQDNIVELQIGQNGDLVIGDIFVDYTDNSISGPGLSVSIDNQLVGLTGLSLHDNPDGTYTIAGVSVAAGSLPIASVTLTYTAPNPVSLTASATISGIISTQVEVVFGTLVTCFASGTLILTEDGEVAVEHLKLGDRVKTSVGQARPIKWLGHRTLNCRRHPRPHEALPVRIAAHAFGESRPTHDLYVSPGHSVCVDLQGEVLIAASALVNGATVQQVPVDEITYWHIELGSHDIIFANGMPAESYLEMNNRSFFAESALVALDAPPDNKTVPTHADFCRPYYDRGPIVDAARAILADRAIRLGWRLAHDLDLYLEVDGRRLDARVRGGLARFHLPAKAKDVWLVTPTARPCDTSGSLDVRELGVQLASVRIEDGLNPPRDVSIADPMFCVGFFRVEDNAYRWTVDRARLPASLWQDCEDDFYLRLELAGPPVPRWLSPVVARPALALVS